MLRPDIAAAVASVLSSYSTNPCATTCLIELDGRITWPEHLQHVLIFGVTHVKRAFGKKFPGHEASAVIDLLWQADSKAEEVQSLMDQAMRAWPESRSWFSGKRQDWAPLSCFQPHTLTTIMDVQQFMARVCWDAIRIIARAAMELSAQELDSQHSRRLRSLPTGIVESSQLCGRASLLIVIY